MTIKRESDIKTLGLGLPFSGSGGLGGAAAAASPPNIPALDILPYRQVDSVWGHEVLDWVSEDMRVGDWGLPGHGEAKETCGIFFMKGCLNVEKHPNRMGYFEPATDRCYSPKCPTCWTNWCKREASRIEHRLEQWRGGGEDIHFVVSVPPRLWHRQRSDLMSLAQKYARRVGLLGGSCIWHPFRKKCGRWYLSPHFHIIGRGWIRGDEVKKVFEETGWFLKHVWHKDEDAPVVKGVPISVYGTAFYQLTHAGIWYGSGRKHCVTWFGHLSYSKLRVRPRPSVPHGCPWCGSKLVRLVCVLASGYPLPSSGGYLADPGGWVTAKEYALEWVVEREPIPVVHQVKLYIGG